MAKTKKIALNSPIGMALIVIAAVSWGLSAAVFIPKFVQSADSFRSIDTKFVLFDSDELIFPRRIFQTYQIAS